MGELQHLGIVKMKTDLNFEYKYQKGACGLLCIQKAFKKWALLAEAHTEIKSLITINQDRKIFLSLSQS